MRRCKINANIFEETGVMEEGLFTVESREDLAANWLDIRLTLVSLDGFPKQLN